MNPMMSASLSAQLKEIITRASAEIAAVLRAEVEQSAPAKAEAPKAAASAPAARKPHPRRSYTDGDIDRVLSLITDKPNLRSEEIKAAVGGDSRVVEKILERMRETGRVQTSGVKRATVYRIAGSDSSPGTSAPRIAAKTARAAAPAKAKRDWPTCSVEGCGKSMFGPSAGRRLCYSHYQEAGGKHYSKA